MIEEGKRYTGLVKFFNKDWGYGMIIPDDKTLTEYMEKKDIMAHATRILEPIQQFDRVEFDAVLNENKVKAHNVKKIK